MSVRGYTPSYTKTSPYGVTDIYGDYMFYYIHRPIGPASSDILMKMDSLRYVARPDLLAYDLYNDADLWWVFGVRNGWEDSVYDLQVGINIYAPTVERLGNIL